MTPPQQEAQPRAGLFTPLRALWDGVLDLIFPPSCLHCGRVDTSWCAHCMGELGRYPLQHLTRHINGLDGAFATGWHEGILQSAIQAFKYAQQRRLAQALAQRMADVLAHSRLAIDTLVPVPLHTLRLQNRGYNQAKELTIALAERVGYAFSGDAITRHRNTRPQVGLNQRERLANMQSAFTADAHHVQGKSLLLIDDVCTTGATLVGCANAAREAGAVAVYALTVTFAMG